jgi:hypothetical protein
MICKNCGEKDGMKYSQYSSGEFCSRVCSRSFSTRNKRLEINTKVSKTLLKKNSGNPKINKICLYCSRDFIVTFSKRNQKTCSHSCSIKRTWENESYRTNASIKSTKARSEGKFSFNSIRCEFIFDGKSVRCDSKLEFNFLTFFCKNYSVIELDRFYDHIEYLYDGKIRRYTPDFIIKDSNGKIYLCECKSVISKNPTNKYSRPLYFLTVDEKKKSLIEHCKINNYIPCWWNNKFTILET